VVTLAAQEATCSQSVLFGILLCKKQLSNSGDGGTLLVRVAQIKVGSLAFCKQSPEAEKSEKFNHLSGCCCL
jgi:hypothetical protein